MALWSQAKRGAENYLQPAQDSCFDARSGRYARSVYKQYLYILYTNVRFRVCVQVFKCFHGMAPDYLSTMCHPVSRLPGRQNLLSANRGQLDVPPLHCRRAVFEPSRMLVHLCGTLCPFISITAI